MSIYVLLVNEFFSNHPVPLSKEGSTFSPSPSSSGSGDVAGDAIALPEFWSASGACALKGWLEVPTQQSCECLCGVNRLAEGLLAVFALICAIFALKLEKNVGNVRGNVYFCELKFVKRLKKKEIMEQEKKYNKLGEWLHSDAEPMIDLSGMSDHDKASLLKMVMR